MLWTRWVNSPDLFRFAWLNMVFHVPLFTRDLYYMNRKRGRESFYLLFSASPFFNFILCLFMPNMGSRHATNSDKHKKKSPQVYQWHMIAHGRILNDCRHHSFNFPWIRESITKRREESGGKQSGMADHHMGG
jgi:hypothetical protein